MNRLLVLVSLLSISLSQVSASAEILNLKMALKESLDNSPIIKKSEAAYDEASWKKAESYQGFLPSLSGSINYLTDKKYMLLDVNLGAGTASVPQVVPTTLYTLNATLPLFDGFASLNRYWAGDNLEASARHELDWTKFSAQRQVILSFYKSLAARALRDVSEQNLKTLTDHFKDVTALKKAGIGTNYDVLRVDVQLSEAKSELLNANDNYEMSKYKLGEAMGKETESRDLQGQLPIINVAQMQQAVAKLKIEGRADLIALKEKVDSLNDLDTAEGRYWVPHVAAFGQYQYYNNINDKFSDRDHFREAYLVGLNLTWNIFDGMSSMAKSHESAAKALQLQNTMRISTLKAAQDLEFWKRKLIYYGTLYEAKTAEVQKSSEALRYAKEGRRAGTRTNTDLLDAELDLFRSKAGVVNAQMGAIEAAINLELSTGQKIYNFIE